MSENQQATLDALRHSKDRVLCFADFWSATQENVTLPAIALAQALPDVTVAGIPAGAVFLGAFAMFKFRIVENTNAAVNAVDGAQHIQVRDDTPGVFRDAISIADNLCSLAAGPIREGGDALIGDHNIVIEVDGNDTYNFQWAAAKCDVANLIFHDVQTGLRVWYLI